MSFFLEVASMKDTVDPAVRTAALQHVINITYTYALLLRISFRLHYSTLETGGGVWPCTGRGHVGACGACLHRAYMVMVII